jgi:hypothetical protein
MWKSLSAPDYKDYTSEREDGKGVTMSLKNWAIGTCQWFDTMMPRRLLVRECYEPIFNLVWSRRAGLLLPFR